MEKGYFDTELHKAPVCVVGGGLSGLCAALACARHGVRVVLMHDRPMLGGNASSEIRMWICGAHGSNNRETGILEEMQLENQYLNPEKVFSLWDGVLHGLAIDEPNLEVLLNCACMDGEMENGQLRRIRGYQTTTQRFHEVEADLFIDCSGDSVLQPITGAPYHWGRESRSEYGESIAPVEADKKTMGMSCLIQAREETWENTFVAPKWAKKITREDLAPYRLPDMDTPMENYWYLELGGEQDCIADTETLRQELLSEAMGLWDYIKNAPENREKNKYWHLDWMGFLPGKRESKRYMGDYVMTQHDVEQGGPFEDTIAYGGWTMDDHNPAGMRTHEKPTIYHPAPSPYGIPYRCLYSCSVPNLMFAGRNISVTHSAFSSTRVMATCATVGQAAGTAAYLAITNGTTPRGVYEHHIKQLQQTLMEDDCYLPGFRRAAHPLTETAKLPDVLKNGIDRPVGEADNGVYLEMGEALEIELAEKTKVGGLRIVWDSDLNRDTLPEAKLKLNRPMLCNRPLSFRGSCVPQTLVRAFRVEALTDAGWETVYEESDNHQRLQYARFDVCASCLRLIPQTTWGAEKAHLFALDILEG